MKQEKTLLIVIVLMAIPFVMQAQTKFHDVELNNATGPVKCIKQGESVTNFTPDGKMQREGMTDAKYDADGYIQSAKMSIQGDEVTNTYKWESGRIKSMTMTANNMETEMTITYTYNDKGVPASQSLNFSAGTYTITYTDYQYDDHGNWISRKCEELEEVETRTIYYEGDPDQKETIAQGNSVEELKKGSVKEIDAAMARTKGTRYVDENYKITLPLHVIGDTKTHDSFSLDGIKATVTLEVINFGQDGNTILMAWHFDTPEIPDQTISWSGKTVHLMPGYDNGIGSFAILRGSTICGQVSCMKRNGELLWAGITNSVEEAITMREFHKGMSISEVEDVWTQLQFCQFKFSRNSGNYKVYSAYWLDMQKRYNIFGDYKYVMRNDKKYADYYFDSQGKLVKWIIYI